MPLPQHWLDVPKYVDSQDRAPLKCSVWLLVTTDQFESGDLPDPYSRHPYVFFPGGTHHHGRPDEVDVLHLVRTLPDEPPRTFCGHDLDRAEQRTVTGQRDVWLCRQCAEAAQYRAQNEAQTRIFGAM